MGKQAPKSSNKHPALQMQQKAVADDDKQQDEAHILPPSPQLLNSAQTLSSYWYYSTSSYPVSDNICYCPVSFTKLIQRL